MAGNAGQLWFNLHECTGRQSIHSDKLRSAKQEVADSDKQEVADKQEVP